MNIVDYISRHAVFTIEDIQAISSSKESAETALRRAVASGKAERIRRGLYASRVGVFRDASPEPMEVVMVADPDAAISYHSALVAHGLAHNVEFECTFRSKSVKNGFEYKGVRYKPFPFDPNVATQRIRYGVDNFANVTTREQTMVDCLAYPNRAGGLEEVIRSLSSIAYLDTESLGRLLAKSSKSVRARAGWLLEANKVKWHVEEAFLKRLASGLNGSVTRFGSKDSPPRAWSKRWNLILPYNEEEMIEWTS